MPAPLDYEILPFPQGRQTIVEAARLAVGRPLIHALLECDVTEARRRLHTQKARTGESFSFTAFIAHCLAAAIVQHPHVQAYRTWRGQLVLFEDVDLSILVETEKDAAALPHILRAVNRKSIGELHAEIRSVQAQPRRSAQDRLIRLSLRLPSFVRTFFMRALRRNPFWLKRNAGTAVLTAVGMFGTGGGWGLGFVPLHTLGLTLGGIAVKPGVADGKIEIREYLCVTLSLDHDVVDGAPAARFAQCFRGLVEQAAGLENLTD